MSEKSSQYKGGSNQNVSHMPKPMSESRGTYVPAPSAVKFAPPSPRPSTNNPKKS